MAKILFVEDDVDLAEMVKTWLASQHHSIEHLTDGQEGFNYLQFGKYDLAIIDWNVPGISGLEICKQHRAKGGATPIIMLTARGAENDKETGLDSGADDYLTKPFSVKELSARLRALLRRPGNVVANSLQIKDLNLDTVKHRLLRNGEEIQLLPKEFSMLEFFMRHPDEVFSSDALLSRVWQSDSEATGNAVRTCLKRLRKKLDGQVDESKSYIQTVAKLGYKMPSQ